MNNYPIEPQVRDRLDNSFTYHSPKGDQPGRYEYIRDNAKALAYVILCNTPSGREQALAMTKLEECVMWANKAIACGER